MRRHVRNDTGEADRIAQAAALGPLFQGYPKRPIAKELGPKPNSVSIQAQQRVKEDLGALVRNMTTDKHHQYRLRRRSLLGSGMETLNVYAVRHVIDMCWRHPQTNEVLYHRI
jgi:hypothetical protein